VVAYRSQTGATGSHGGVASPGTSRPCRTVTRHPLKATPSQQALATTAGLGMGHARHERCTCCNTYPDVFHTVGLPVHLDQSDQARWWRNRKMQHLRNRVAMNAKPLSHSHRLSPSPSLHVISRHRVPLVHILPASHASEKLQDGLTGPVHFCAAIKRRSKPVQWSTLAALFIR
jgi:hypothetical protein